jgi:hypothetical protein
VAFLSASLTQTEEAEGMCQHLAQQACLALGNEGDSVCGQSHQSLQVPMEKLQSCFLEVVQKQLQFGSR